MKMHPTMRRIIATKPHKYGTRHLTAGEEYEAPPRHAFALVAARKARFVEEKKTTWGRGPIDPQTARDFIETIHPPEIAPVEPEHEPSIDNLRLQATQLGINVDGRWGIARLQHEIDQARR